MAHIVIGAGIAGLTTAFHLMERGEDVVVLEATDRIGGMMRTVSESGMLLECGPQTAQATPAALRLIARLGLKSEVVWPSSAAKRRYVLKSGTLVALPHSIASFLSTPLLPPSQRLRMAVEPLVRTQVVPGETLFQLVARRLGPGAAEAFIEPFVAGVFGASARELEAASAFAKLVDLERQHGSIMGGALFGQREARPAWAQGTMFSLQRGMYSLCQRLAERLGGRVLLHERVRSIRRDGRDMCVATEDGDFRADHVWSTVSPSVVVNDWPATRRAPIVSVNLWWPRESLPQLDGFGWLAPKAERTDALGALWVSASLPGHAPGRALIRVMMGGTRDPMAAVISDDEAVERACRVVSEVQGIRTPPEGAHVWRTVPGIPQYEPGHAQRVRALREQSDVRWLGWEVSGVGLSHIFAAAERVGSAPM